MLRHVIMHLACVSPLAIAHPSLAQTRAEQPLVLGNPIIVVTGRGLADTPATPAYNVQEIGREEIVSSASGRIEDVLAGVAGFQQFRRSDSRSSNPSAQGVTLRALGGNASSRALVLLDGVPQADPFFGYIPLSAMDPARIQNVRVTRGGGAGAFGSGSVAGSIELTSADAANLGPLSGSALVNDRGESELSALVAPQLGQGFAVIGGRWDRGKGFYTTPEAQRVPATARARFESWSASARAVVPLTDQVELQASGQLFDDRRTLRFEGGDSTSKGQDASIRLVGRGGWQFDALAYVQARNFSNVVISSTRFTRTLDQRNTPSTGIGGKLELRPPLGKAHVLRLGADLRISEGHLEEEAYNAVSGAQTARRRAGGRNSDIGLFAEHDWTLGPVVVTGGIRADRWTIRDGFFRAVDGSGTPTVTNRFAGRAGWDTSFRGGAVWRAGGGLSLRAAGYNGLRLPTLNELYRPFVVFPVETIANENLRNEELEGFEAGVDFVPNEAVSLSVTAFDNKVRHAIANVTIATNVRQRRNVDAVSARGLEFDADWRLGAFTLSGSLALTDAQVRATGGSVELDGMRPAHVPKTTASVTLAWHPAAQWRLAATIRRAGAEFEDDLETDRLPATTTLGAYAQVPLLPGVSVVLRGENLTGERIVTRNQGGSIDLGAPRTLWAGLALRSGGR